MRFRFEAIEFFAVHDADIGNRFGIVGNDIGFAAAGADGKVDGGLFVRVFQRHEFLDLIGQFDKGVAAIFRIASGMGFYAGHFNDQIGRAFSPHDDAVAYLSRLHAEGSMVFFCQCLQQVMGIGRADFFVAVEKEGKGVVIMKIHGAELFHGKQRQGDAAFAVGYAGAANPFAIDGKWPFGCRAGSKNGIHMRHGKEFPFAGAFKLHEDMGAVLGILAWDFGNRRAEFFKRCRNDLRHLVDAFTVSRAGVDIYNRSPKVDEFRKGCFAAGI